MASRDTESLASPGMLPGHTGRRDVMKLLGDQDSRQLAAATHISHPLKGWHNDTVPAS
jgi:hypothetical protein